MNNFNFLEKGLAIVSPPHFVIDFSREMLMIYSIDKISVSDCLYFLRYQATYVSQLFVSQVVTS